MSEASASPESVVDRLVEALNQHDLDAMVSCFAGDYLNETPAHPLRGFRGNDQVRRNWTQIFTNVPDLHADVLRTSVDGSAVWTEWDISGNLREGGAFLMRGVVIFGVRDSVIASARFYLEPVEEASGDVDRHTRRVVGAKS